MAVNTGVFATKLLPSNLSDDDAAGLLIPYVTVMWSFVEKARLRKGQTVRIHSAAGGVGIAAIHVALWIVAQIYAKPGTQAKFNFLAHELGIHRDHISNSHDDSFAAAISAATGGRGVDAVLNSLSGELLHSSWGCKRDFLGRARLAMHVCVENCAYFGIDLSRLLLSLPEAMRAISRQTMDLLEQGLFRPLWPATVFDTENVEDAFRLTQKGVHMGRIVVRMPEDCSVLPIAPSKPAPCFRADETYFLGGVMGSLRRSIIRWKASDGAREITRDEDRMLVIEMQGLGCAVHCIVADITDARPIKDAIGSVQKPIAGVLQMAMILSEVGILNLDFGSWTAAVRPKIQGTRNLHHMLPRDLDFFALFGSISGTLASYGQANYPLGNTFDD